MVGWMDTNRWMVGLIEKKAYEQNDGYKNISIIDGWLNGQKNNNEKIAGWLDGQEKQDGWMDKKMYGSLEKWMDG